MFPMDYEEFRWALGDEVGMSLLKQVFEKRMSLGEGINRMKMRDLRLYMLVGGMPSMSILTLRICKVWIW